MKTPCVQGGDHFPATPGHDAQLGGASNVEGGVGSHWLILHKGNRCGQESISEKHERLLSCG
jgi:hypothetical protein